MAFSAVSYEPCVTFALKCLISVRFLREAAWPGDLKHGKDKSRSMGHRPQVSQRNKLASCVGDGKWRHSAGGSTLQVHHELHLQHLLKH